MKKLNLTAITAAALAVITVASVGTFAALSNTKSGTFTVTPANKEAAELNTPKEFAEMVSDGINKTQGNTEALKNGKAAKVIIPATVKGDYDFWYVLNGADVKVSGRYNYQSENYEFVFTGRSKSSGNLIMTYLDNGRKQLAYIPLAVDKDLNVTQSGTVMYETAETTPQKQTEEKETAQTNNQLNGKDFYYTAQSNNSVISGWTYKINNANVYVDCKYDNETQQYTFIVKGLGKGEADVDFIYKSGDNWITVTKTLSVDAQGNVTEV